VGLDDVTRAAAVLGDAAPFPMDGGEPVFAEPWEGRAFAMAVDVVARVGLPWESFRARLVAAIADDPHRAYYESWVVALEGLVVDAGAVSVDGLDRARDQAASYRYHEHGVGDVEVFPIRLAELPAVLATLDLATPFDVTACRHAERYRVLDGGSPGEWRCRAFDATDALLLDVPARF
jgi:nitrile hydratase accessory protein